MTTSKTIHSFQLSKREGQPILTAQEHPWSILQVVLTTPDDFNRVRDILSKRGFVAHHDTDRTFLIIHLGSGNTDGKHPEREISITQDNSEQVLATLRDTMAQAAVWYYTNVILSPCSRSFSDGHK